jgi:rhodanese-related sulfurtransferase
MAELLQEYPGAQRALFARYHIGGCSSCGFSPTETVGEVCERNENVDVDEVLAHVRDSHQADASLQITPSELVSIMKANPKTLLLDVRTREEHEAVALPGSRLVTQAVVQEVFDTVDKSSTVIFYDHMGNRSLDATTYFVGHGFANAKCLAGGINAYSTEIDPTIPRYFVELE